MNRNNRLFGKSTKLSIMLYNRNANFLTLVVYMSDYHYSAVLGNQGLFQLIFIYIPEKAVPTEILILEPIHKENPTRCHSVSKFYFILL